MAVSVAPYPYDRWPRLSRIEAAALSGLARLAVHAEGSAGARMIEAASAALGVELSITPGPARVVTQGELAGVLPEPVVGVELSARHEGLDVTIVLELTAELASWLVDRTLGGSSASVRVPGLGLDELELGVLGYLAARACAASSAGLGVRTVTRSRTALLETLAAEDGSMVLWPLELSAGDRGGAARALLPRAASRALATSTKPRRRFDVPSALLGLPVQLCAHAATVRLTAPELAALEPGDVVVPERTALALGEHGWYGHCALHALGTRGWPHAQHARCALSEHVLRIEAIEQGEHAMSHDNPEALVKDAPIELCVELARFTVRLEDLLGLRVGEVLQTGRAIGEHVVLTAHGRPIARGELVEVEGDVGVRILEKHS